MGTPDRTRPRLPLLLALLATAGIALGAAGGAAAYWLDHSGGPEVRLEQSYDVELRPTAPGPYQVYLPLPAGRDGQLASGFALQVLDGAPRFGVVQTEHGIALSVRAEGPVKLHAGGPLPLRLSLDDVPAKHAQFRFWGFLGQAAAPVLLKLEVREQNFTANWTQRTSVSHGILLQLPLEVRGWQVVKATHVFDFLVGGGFEAGFPRVALGAIGASLVGTYPPLGVVLLGLYRPRHVRGGA